jgi:16S rRNA (cytosine1402-N4)-methyltransferase
LEGHTSVLLKEAIDWLCVDPHGSYLDCTGGVGGHSAELLKRLADDARLIICDYDKKAVSRLKQRFDGDERVQVMHARFSSVFDNLNFSFSGVLADFGISSLQLEDPDLGIGFQLEDAPLDMRIDSNLTETAADILKSRDEAEMADIFYYFGGERAGRRIARAIAHDRTEGTYYTTTKDLKELCARVLGRFYRGRRIDPATKVFQGLRIAVNKELDEVKALLEVAPEKLAVGGRFVVISFHEGEDRLAKKVLRELAQKDGFRLPVRKVTKPSEEEIKENPRARSAKMRILERVAV